MEPKTPPFGGNHKVKFAENEGGKSFDDTDFFLSNPVDSGNTVKRIDIENNVWVAASCVIAKGSKLCKGCIIGANSFVNCEIPRNAIAAGSPAKVIKFRQ